MQECTRTVLLQMLRQHRVILEDEAWLTTGGHLGPRVLLGEVQPHGATLLALQRVARRPAPPLAIGAEEDRAATVAPDA